MTREPEQAPHLWPVPDMEQDVPAPVSLVKPATDLAVPVDADVVEGRVLPRRLHVLDARAAVETVRVVATHPRTKAVARHVVYVAGGVAVVTRRLWDGRTTARYERMMRSAEAAGDHQAALEWEARVAAFRRDRHGRRMDLFELPVKVLAKSKDVALGVLAVLVGLGVLLAVADKDARQVAAPTLAVAHIVRLVFLVVSVAWGPILLAAPWVAVLALWSVGRSHAAAATTGWAARLQPQGAEVEMVVTADTIVLALQHLGLPKLTKAFKDGWIPAFTQQPIRDGRGYWMVFGLPLGVTAEMVADQRKVLARNVHRAEVETWPSDAEKVGTGPAGSVDLWVADAGALSKPAPEYPLLHEGTADVFEGVPAGVSPRGDVIMVPVVGNNFVAGGQMGQGKSNACRVVMLGCAMDPLAELDVFVFAANGDFDAYQPRLARYARGIDDATAAAALHRLRELYEEVARREGRLADLGAKKVTRGLAKQHPDLRPKVALFSECHELFGHPEFGDESAELATKTAKRARKTAITLMFDTQSSRKEAIPPKLVELVSVNCCFYVKTWRSNDGFLGDGSFAAGIRATELRPGRDRGTSLITGVSDAPFELLKWHYVEVDDDTGWDAATDAIARAVAQVAPGTRMEAISPPPVIEVRDLLDDLDQVLGSERVRLADVPALLRDLAPHWPAYRTLTGAQLREQLAEHEVRVTNTGNVLRLDPVDLRRALAEQVSE
jgi:S-DNA-T family DNA segregation ATPase FtsK/SpoIIIE